MSKSNAPIIVCGPPRSATTMMLQLLGSHHRISATQETCYDFVEALIEYINKCREIALSLPRFKKKRWVTNDRAMYENMVAELWYATTEAPVRRERLAHKTPCTEKYFDFYNEIFNGEAKFIYCMRHPISQLRSHANIVRREGRSPFKIKSSIKIYKKSVYRYLDIKDKHPNTILLIQADKIEATDAGRLEMGNKVMNFIGEEMDEEVRQMLIRNEVINPKKKRRELSEEEMEVIENDKELTEIRKMFGYA